MSTNFPGSLDTSTTIPAEGASVPLATNHVIAHQNIQDAIEAVEAKVGADGSAVTTSHDYKLSLVTSTDKSLPRDAAATTTNKTLGSGTKVAIGSDADKDMYYRASDGSLTRIPVGTDNQILKLNGTTPNWEAETATVDATTSVKGVVELATSAEINVATALGSTGAALSVTPDQLSISRYGIPFGGDGSDGALSVSSGNTNIDLSGARFVVKNYTSISITGTGSITFTNPHTNGTIIILRSQGAVTLTSSATPMIDASGCGATGATGPTQSGAGSQTYTPGTNGYGVVYKTNAATTGSGGAAADIYTTYQHLANALAWRYIMGIPGAGGSGGSASTSGVGDVATGGNGGRGGGFLAIECAGAWNFTTANGISVAGKNATNGSGTNNYAATGGSGGAAGYFLGLYSSLTANSGSVTITGGTGGNHAQNGLGGTTQGPGSGSSAISAGNAGTTTGTTGVKNGADGPSGYSFVGINTYF